MSTHRNKCLKSRLSGACFVVLLGCAPIESGAEARLEAKADAALEAAAPPAFPILKWGELSPLEGGSFRGRASFGQHGFLTMEHTIFDSIEGRWQLELAPGGIATACFVGKRRNGGSISRYASDDGTDQHHEYETEWTLGLAGRWQKGVESDGRASVSFDRMGYGSCSIDGAAAAIPEVLPWTCWRLQSPREAEGAVIACRVPLVGQPEAVTRSALAVRETPRDGSWEMRELPARRGPTVFDSDARPWLLAGQVVEGAGGLVVHSRDDGPRGGHGQVDLRLESQSLEALHSE